MIIKETSNLTPEQEKAILTIWNKVYPSHLSYSSIDGLHNYLQQLANSTHYVAFDVQLIGWLSVFDREGERWLVLIVDDSYHGKGIGTALLDRAKANEQVLNGWVIDHNEDQKPNGTFYTSPLSFYLKNGFEILNQRLEKGKLSAIKIRWSRKSV